MSLVGQSAAGAVGGIHGFAPALTSFVGRAAVVAEVADMVGEHRLVTGPGGRGMTCSPAIGEMSIVEAGL